MLYLRWGRKRLKILVGFLVLSATFLTLVISSFSEGTAANVKFSGYMNVDFISTYSGIKGGFKVEITETGKNVFTDSNGYFEIADMQAGSVYTVKISKAGFLSRTISNITADGNVLIGSQGAPAGMWAGDINQDNAINMADVVTISKSFNSVPGDARYDPVNDFNMDNACNMADIMIALKHFNRMAADYPTVNVSVQKSTPLPISTQTPTPTYHLGANLIKNGDFSNGISGWTLWTETGASATNTVVNGENKTSISNTGPNPWSVHIYQGTFSIVSGKTYELSMDARATLNRSIKVTVENGTTYTQYFYNTFAVNNTMSRYAFRFKADTSDSSARIVIIFGSIDGLISQSHDVFLDNIVLGELNGASITPPPTPTPLPSSVWKLIWSDEFNGASGSKPDSAKWGYDIGGGGWGNNELEYYTDSVKNSYQENGHLIIKAINENFGTNNYTSARLLTKGKFQQTYGRFEARMKLPYGQGIWPAFWMLGNDIDTVSWPGCGEIDIMENIGKEPNMIHGTIHGPGYSGGNGLGASYTGTRFADDYHTFAVEWEPNAIRWYCDGNLYETRTSRDVGSNKWVYDHPFFMILNVAVGGGWPGNPDNTTVFPQVMEVDYVRVYQR